MSEENLKEKSRTDWDRLDRMRDEEIDYSEIPPLDEEFFKTGELRMPETTTLIPMRMDPDVLAWFKMQGKEYQTRINAVLRMYMESQTAK